MTLNATRAHQCTPPSNQSAQDDPQYNATQLIQARTAVYNQYIGWVSGIPSLIVVPLFATFSDKLGRRVPLLLATLGESIKTVLMCLMIWMQWPLWVMLVAFFISGVAGGYATVTAGTLAYLAELTTKKQRAFRMAVLEAAFGLTASASEIGVGWWIRLSGYEWPYTFATASVATCFLYVLFGVPEVRHGKGKRHRRPDDENEAARCTMLWTHLYNMVTVFTKDGRPTKCLLATLLALLIFGMSAWAFNGLSYIYYMNYPFCWDSVDLGYFFAGYLLAVEVGMLVIVKLLNDRLNSLTFAILGLLSSSAGRTIVATATSNTALYMILLAMLLSKLPIPMMRAYMSKQIPSKEQGSLFASIGEVEVLCFMFGNTLFNFIYQHTLFWFRGFVFVLMVCFNIVSILILSGVSVIDKLAVRKGSELRSVHRDDVDTKAN